MSSFCGYIGKTDSKAIDNRIKKTASECSVPPIGFEDGCFHFGFCPFDKKEEENLAHNEDFTIWVMLDCGYGSSEYTAKKFVEAYENKGIWFVKELEGTFSFALWDGLQKRLYLVKDRYGAKPLLYANVSEGFFFGSQIGAILEVLDKKPEINTSALYQYLSFQSVYLPETVFRHIYHVSPGCFGVYAEGKFEEVSYVDLKFGEINKDTYEEASQKVEEYLRKSVRKCLEEGNAGILLSGGLDSSVVAALAPYGAIEHSFCLKPMTKQGSLHKKEEDAYFSKFLANKYGFTHHVIDMTPMDLVEGIDEIVKSFSQPFSGTASGYFTYKYAGKVCNRILTGDGADEIFGSYRHHSVVIPLERYAKLRNQGESIVGKEKLLVPYENNLSFLDALYQYGGTNDTLWYYRLLPMGDGEKSLFLNRDRFEECMEKQSTLELCVNWDKKLKSGDVLNRSLERDFMHLLPGHTMLYQDTLARKFDINLVMPFLNNQLTDYMATMPAEYKINEGTTKSILKGVASNYLPEEIVYRRKEPFTLPVLEWMLTDLKEYVTDILSEENIKKYALLEADSVSYALNEYYKYPNEKSYYGGMLWNMVILQKWAMLYM